MKKFWALILSIAMTLSLSISAFAAEPVDEISDLQTAYERIVRYATTADIPLDMSFDDFVSMYNGEGVSKFENSFYTVLQPQVSTYSSGGKRYYYNTGTTCPSEATYTKYNLLSVVKKGDVIFEANGGFGITGHIAIVEDILTDASGKKYIRLVEAIDDGVVRSILDDTRYDEKGVTVLHVSGATKDIIDAAVSFCVNELGSSYSLDFQKDTSAAETDWYCSELVWAAYKNQGINIEVDGNGEPGVTPRDIRNSSKTIARTVSSK